MQSKNLSLFLNSNIFQEPFFFYFGRMDGLQSEGVVLIPLTILRASQYQSSNKKHSNQTMWARYHHAATCAPRRCRRRRRRHKRSTHSLCRRHFSLERRRRCMQ